MKHLVTDQMAMTLDDLKAHFLLQQTNRLQNRYIVAQQDNMPLDVYLLTAFESSVNEWADWYYDKRNVIEAGSYRNIDQIRCGQSAAVYVYAREHGIDAAILMKLSMDSC